MKKILVRNNAWRVVGVTETIAKKMIKDKTWTLVSSPVKIEEVKKFNIKQLIKWMFNL